MHNDMEYVQADYVLQYAPIYSKGCRGTRDLLKKKQITEYIFMRLVKDDWEVSNGSSQKFDKVFIPKTFLDNIPELNNVDKIVDNNGIEKAPLIIYLQEHEKFYDNDGNTLDIETRGDRNVNNVYFKVTDIMEEFNIKYLNDSITHKQSNYVYNDDYKYFICNSFNDNTHKKELFLTYRGMLHLLFNSVEQRTKEINIVNNIKKYIKYNWICNKSLKCLYRPDMYTILDNNLLIIEIDEYQHKGYDKKEEKKRINIIMNELKCENTIIIRINPDYYKDSNNNKHIGIDDNIEEFNKRMNIIIDSTNYILKHNKDKYIVHYLFFDGYVYEESINTLCFEYNENDTYKRINGIRNKFIERTFIFNKKQQQYNLSDYNVLNDNSEYIEQNELHNKQIQSFEMEIEKLKLAHENELKLNNKDNELKLKEKDNELKLMEKDNEILKLNYQLKEKENEILKKELEMMRKI